ncbi:MAG TPA: glycoside hydrolase family 97 N-terminal domain-containing protein, partial [Chitinophagaceae bacterium]
METTILKKKIIIACCFALLALSIVAQDSLRLRSPNGNIHFQLSIIARGEVNYAVSYKQQEIIKPSVLGVDGWQNNLMLRAVTSFKKDTSWKPVYGERNLIRDHYNAKVFTFWKNKNERQAVQIEVRAYDEGIAFRYYFTEFAGGGSDILINKDLTAYSLPENTKAWFTDHAQGFYQLLDLNKWPVEAERPLTLQLSNGLYVTLAEAQVEDYCRTKFVLHPAKPNTIACSMYDKVELTTPFATPWHVIMIAEKATQLLQNNDLI